LTLLVVRRDPIARAPPLEAVQRRYLRQPGSLRIELDTFPTVVSYPSWHIACTSGAQQQPNN